MACDTIWNTVYRDLISRHRYSLFLPEPFLSTTETDTEDKQANANISQLMLFILEIESNNGKDIEALKVFFKVFEKHCDYLCDRFRAIRKKEQAQYAIYLNRCLLEDCQSLISLAEQRVKRLFDGLTESDIMYLKSSFMMHCRYTSLCFGVIKHHEALLIRRRTSVDEVIQENEHDDRFQTDGPLCSMVQDNLRDPSLIHSYGRMKEDERFIFKRSDKVQLATQQAFRVAYGAHLCLVDHSTQGSTIEFASMGFCDLLGRYPWDVHGNALVNVLGISNMDEQDERFKVLSSRTDKPEFSWKVGSVLYPAHTQIMKNIEDFISYLEESSNISPSDKRSLPMVGGIFNLHMHGCQNTTTEVVIVMLEVYMQEPDYDDFDAEAMHEHRRLLVIVADIGSVVQDVMGLMDSIIIMNRFSFEHLAVSKFLYESMIRYTNEFNTTRQGLPRVYPIDIERNGWIEPEPISGATICVRTTTMRQPSLSSIVPSHASTVLTVHSDFMEPSQSLLSMALDDSEDSFFERDQCCAQRSSKQRRRRSDVSSMEYNKDTNRFRILCRNIFDRVTLRKNMREWKQVQIRSKSFEV